MQYYPVPDTAYLCVDSNNLKQTIYHNSSVYIKFLLDSWKACNNIEEQYNIMKTLFEFLINNPTILIYVPNFRNAIIEQLYLIEQDLEYQTEILYDANYDHAFDAVRFSISSHIMNSKIKLSILDKIDEIMNEVYNYHKWLHNDELRVIIQSLRYTIHNIRQHPDYVTDD